MLYVSYISIKLGEKDAYLMRAVIQGIITIHLKLSTLKIFMHPGYGLILFCFYHFCAKMLYF